MDSGAWPFLVGGVNCLVNSVNERDLNLLNSRPNLIGVLMVHPKGESFDILVSLNIGLSDILLRGTFYK